MKKILVIFFLGLFFYNPSSFAVIKGKGEVKLSERSLQNFLWYLRGDWPERDKGKYTPAVFVLSSDGAWSYFHWCGHTECWQNEKKTVERCERETGVACGAFAVRRTIYWDNGLNEKKPRINSKWSEAKIKEELTKAGFWGDENTSSTTTTSDETKYPKSLFPADSYKKEQWNEFKKYDKEAFAKVIYLEIYDNASQTFHKPKKFVIKRRESDGLYSFTYTLDSAVLRNISKIHFSAYITCNGKDYGFDGESFSRMQAFKWKSKLNLNSK